MNFEIILHNLEDFLRLAVDAAILLFEYMGVLVLILTGIRGIVDYFRRSPSIRLQLARGLAMGLEFKLGSEILRTVTVRELQEIALVGAIILLRAALTLLIHWEIKNEELHNDGSVTTPPEPLFFWHKLKKKSEDSKETAPADNQK